MKHGIFITIEGCEGAGKSTLVRKLKERLQQSGTPYVFTREPGGTPLAEALREMVLSTDVEPVSETAELFLYEAARAQHVFNRILPALRQGMLVLCDRFTDSTLAYQGYARGISLDLIRTANAAAMQGAVPDATIFLDIPPAEAFLRKGGADKGDRIEKETLAFHERVYEGFKAIAALEPQRVISVDARISDPDAVFRAALCALSERGIRL